MRAALSYGEIKPRLKNQLLLIFNSFESQGGYSQSIVNEISMTFSKSKPLSFSDDWTQCKEDIIVVWDMREITDNIILKAINLNYTSLYVTQSENRPIMFLNDLRETFFPLLEILHFTMNSLNTNIDEFIKVLQTYNDSRTFIPSLPTVPLTEIIYDRSAKEIVCTEMPAIISHKGSLENFVSSLFELNDKLDHALNTKGKLNGGHY